jgi:hypothetical protein
MTTATLTKETVEAKWNVEKLQEEFARTVATNSMTAMSVMSKHGEEMSKEFSTAMRHGKVEHLKQLGVKTPVELVKAMAEMEANLFGSKIEIWGDEKAAHIKYVSCGMWNAMKKVSKMDAQEETKWGAKMATQMDSCMQEMAKEFGFKSEMKIEGQVCSVSFTK